jgi:hypothetical protein
MRKGLGLAILFICLLPVTAESATQKKAATKQPIVTKKLCADPAFIRKVTAEWNKSPHTGPNAKITSLKFYTVVRGDCIYEIDTKTDPSTASLFVTPKRGGGFDMTLGD